MQEKKGSEKREVLLISFSISARFVFAIIKVINFFRLNKLQLKLQATNLCLLYADSKLNGQDPEFFRSGGVSTPVPKQFTFTVRLGL